LDSWVLHNKERARRKEEGGKRKVRAKSFSFLLAL
jgi:hypothetical protein